MEAAAGGEALRLRLTEHMVLTEAECGGPSLQLFRKGNRFRDLKYFDQKRQPRCSDVSA